VDVCVINPNNTASAIMSLQGFDALSSSTQRQYALCSVISHYVNSVVPGVHVAGGQTG